jgi:hypothetical protein
VIQKIFTGHTIPKKQAPPQSWLEIMRAAAGFESGFTGF